MQNINFKKALFWTIIIFIILMAGLLNIPPELKVKFVQGGNLSVREIVYVAETMPDSDKAREAIDRSLFRRKPTELKELLNSIPEHPESALVRLSLNRASDILIYWLIEAYKRIPADINSDGEVIKTVFANHHYLIGELAQKASFAAIKTKNENLKKFSLMCATVQNEMQESEKGI